MKRHRFYCLLIISKGIIFILDFCKSKKKQIVFYARDIYPVGNKFWFACEKFEFTGELQENLRYAKKEKKYVKAFFINDSREWFESVSKNKKKKLYRSLSVLILKSDSCLPKKKILFALMIALETLWKMLFISF